MPVFQQRGEWFEVRYRRRRGWVRNPEEIATRSLGNAPASVLPVPGREPNRERLRQAVAPFGTQRSAGSLGEYELYTDVEDPVLIDWLDRVVAGVEAAYRARYGVAPIDRAREAIVLYARQEDFEVLSQRLPLLPSGEIAGLASDGLVAVAAGELDREQLAGTLIHELAHLLNRRALGPALPPWLDEGIARDLGSSEVDAAGRIRANRVGGSVVRQGDLLEWRGGQASLVALRRRHRRGHLRRFADLVTLDREAFYDGLQHQLHYDQSAFLVRYLLQSDDPEMGVGLREYLRSVAAGGPVEATALSDRLSISWSRLGEAFGEWLQAQQPLEPEPLATPA